VFTHGGPIRVGVASALGLPAGGERALGAVANCSVTLLERHDEHLVLVAYNRVDHLADSHLDRAGPPDPGPSAGRR
ncbi:MAG: histidine phosphatase family protein, partial [Actinomycetota bacterium]|nr:histidine phosphatase family protein [Actinomycetota bacterium]